MCEFFRGGGRVAVDVSSGVKEAVGKQWLCYFRFENTFMYNVTVLVGLKTGTEYLISPVSFYWCRMKAKLNWELLQSLYRAWLSKKIHFSIGGDPPKN